MRSGLIDREDMPSPAVLVAWIRASFGDAVERDGCFIWNFQNDQFRITVDPNDGIRFYLPDGDLPPHLDQKYWAFLGYCLVHRLLDFSDDDTDC
jgi:hypothetical protein